VNVRIPAVDGLRGIAVLAVVQYHIQMFLGANSPHHIGWAGVDLFFVISGFLITGILLDSRQDPHYYRAFYARRTVRIFPIYYVSLLCAFLIAPSVLAALGRGESIEPVLRLSAQGWAWSYMLNWLMGLQSFNAACLYIQHFWSLSVEEQFYLCWPTVVRRITRRRLFVTCGCLMAVALAARVALHILHLPGAAFAWTVCRVDSLAVGAAIAGAARNTGDWAVFSRFAPRLAALSLTAIAAIVALRRTAYQEDPWIGTAGISLLAVFFGAALILGVNARASGRYSTLLRSRLLAFFGKYSYGIYVFHHPIVVGLAWRHALLRRLADTPLGYPGATLVLYALATGLTIVCALISWHLIERPFIRLKELPSLQVRTFARAHSG
jgi:peptidoglycan/LPS O-acetylase OafA/YrhL